MHFCWHQWLLGCLLAVIRHILRNISCGWYFYLHITLVWFLNFILLFSFSSSLLLLDFLCGFIFDHPVIIYGLLKYFISFLLSKAFYSLPTPDFFSSPRTINLYMYTHVYGEGEKEIFSQILPWQLVRLLYLS